MHHYHLSLCSTHQARCFISYGFIRVTVSSSTYGFARTTPTQARFRRHMSGTLSQHQLQKITPKPLTQELIKYYNSIKAKLPDEVQDVNVDELHKWLCTGASDIVLVDVRDEEEIVVSQLPGAVTKAQFEASKRDFKDRKVVCYCTVGYRSGLYSAQLLKEGFDAYNLTASIIAWAQAGLPLVQQPDGSVTNMLHTFSASMAQHVPPEYQPTFYKQPVWKYVQKRLLQSIMGNYTGWLFGTK